MISPRGTGQSVPVSCALLVSFPFVNSCYRLVSVHLEAYTDQGDCITCNLFVRNVWNGYVLEFAQGNAPLLSRVPIAFGSARVDSGCELLNNAVSKLLEKEGDRTCRG